MFKKVIKSMTSQKDAQRRAELYRKLIRHEAQIGGQLFGPVQPGGRREFFCLDPHTWVWHEEWKDENGQHQYATTRYDVHESGIVKSQNGVYKPVSLKEAENLQTAVHLYRDRVKNELYSFLV
jgi:hypothetical protein